METKYKKYIPKSERKTIEGLGDWLEQKITKPLGIKKAVENVTKVVGIKDCGCNKRKQILNELMPFNNDKHSSSS